MPNTKQLNCEVCKKPMLEEEPPDSILGGTFGMMGELRRAMFTFDEDGAEVEVNVKASFYICPKCWLEDPDLCRFMNKIGWRTR